MSPIGGGRGAGSTSEAGVERSAASRAKPLVTVPLGLALRKASNAVANSHLSEPASAAVVTRLLALARLRRRIPG